MSEKCAECGNAIFPGQAFYKSNPMGLGVGKDSYYHSSCGDVFGIKAKDAEIERLRAALSEIRERAATIKNGGAWACGIAALCLAGIDRVRDEQSANKETQR